MYLGTLCPWRVKREGTRFKEIFNEQMGDYRPHLVVLKLLYAGAMASRLEGVLSSFMPEEQTRTCPLSRYREF